MAGVVVDSCVVAKWVLAEPDQDQAEKLIDGESSGTELLVLDLAFTEVASAVWKRHRLGQMNECDASAALKDLFRCPVTVEQSIPLVNSALEIAMKYGRSVYDALFVALVAKTGFAGVTADVPLFNAVRVDFPAIVLLRDWK
jgi:predicted nucleic acid-binding protein